MFNNILFACFAAHFLFVNFASAQVERFNNKYLHLKYFAELPGYGVDVSSKTSSRKVQWRPNTRVNTGLGFSIKGFLGFSISGKGDSENTLYKGDTDYADYRISYNPDNFYLAVGYQNYKGFYIENSSDIDPSYLGSKYYIKSSQMSTTSYSANFLYIFDPKNFSVTAALDQVHRQNTSGGSWVAGVSATKITYQNPDTFVPQIVRSEFGEDQNTIQIDFSSLTVKGGYGVTGVLAKNWYLSALGTFGLGVQYGTHEDSTKSHTTSRTATSLDLWLSAGYSGDDYFSGAIFKDELEGYQTDSMNISATIYSFGFFIGARF